MEAPEWDRIAQSHNGETDKEGGHKPNYFRRRIQARVQWNEHRRDDYGDVKRPVDQLRRPHKSERHPKTRQDSQSPRDDQIFRWRWIVVKSKVVELGRQISDIHPV